VGRDKDSEGKQVGGLKKKEEKFCKTKKGSIGERWLMKTGDKPPLS